MQRRCTFQQGSSHPSLCHCPLLGQGHPSPCELLSCVGLNLGSHQEGIKVPALPTSSFLTLWWGCPSHLPGPPQAGGSAQVTLGPQSLPQCPSQAVLSPWALPCQQHLAVLPQRGWADAVGEALSKQGGDRRTRSRTGADRCELVCGGQSKAEGMRLELCQTWAVNVVATRHRDRDVRGRAALLGGTGGTETAHPRAQGRAAGPCLCKTRPSRKASLCSTATFRGVNRTWAPTPPHTPRGDGMMKPV